MKTQNENQESGAAGKPGETTTVTDKALTAAGVTDLLNSEFATEAEEPEKPAATEIPAEGEPEGESKVESAEEGVRSEGEENAEGGAGSAELEAGAKNEGGEAAEEIPAEMQDALTEWEAKGGPLPASLQAVVGKRIGKLTADKTAAEDRATKAEADLAKVSAEAEELRNDPQRPGRGAPAGVPDEATLTKTAQSGRKFVTEVQNYLDDAATPEEKGRVERFMESKQLDLPKLRRELRTVNDWLTQELPGQVAALREFRKTEAANAPVAKKWFGKLDDKTSKEYQQMQGIMDLLPELTTRTPAHRIAAGTYVLGLKVIDHLQAAGKDADAFSTVDQMLAKMFPLKDGKPAAGAAPAKPPPKTAAGQSAAAPGATRAKIKPAEAASAALAKAPTAKNAAAAALASLNS